MPLYKVSCNFVFLLAIGIYFLFQGTAWWSVLLDMLSTFKSFNRSEFTFFPDNALPWNSQLYSNTAWYQLYMLLMPTLFIFNDKPNSWKPVKASLFRYYRPSCKLKQHSFKPPLPPLPTKLTFLSSSVIVGYYKYQCKMYRLLDYCSTGLLYAKKNQKHNIPISEEG